MFTSYLTQLDFSFYTFFLKLSAKTWSLLPYTKILFSFQPFLKSLAVEHSVILLGVHGLALQHAISTRSYVAIY